MSECLDRCDGDTFESQAEHDLFKQLQERGEVVASNAWDGGWGHHSVEAVVVMDNKFYRVSAGGCSCDGSANVTGPFDTSDEAGIGEEGMSEGDYVREG